GAPQGSPDLSAASGLPGPLGNQGRLRLVRRLHGSRTGLRRLRISFELRLSLTGGPQMSNPTVKVLVVAEEVLVRRTLAMELAACLAGAEVTPAGGDEEATEILRQHPHDVALVDIGAQEGDGIKLLREIRTRWPQLHVILLSDREDGETVR